MIDLGRIEQPPGTSADSLASYAIRTAASAAIFLLISIVLSLAAAHARHSVVALVGPWFLAAFVVCCVLAAFFIVLRNQRQSVEAKAGYVTLPYALRELDQVDPKTGYVIRKAGDPFLTRVQLRTARAEAAAKAQEEG